MSETPPEPESITLPAGDGAFGALMDALVPETPSGTDETAGAPAAGEGSTPVRAGQPGEAAVPGGADPSGGAGAGAGTGAAAGEPGAGGAAAAPDAGQPAGGSEVESWTVDPATIIPELGKLSTSFEENTSKAYTEEALTAVREEHGAYFEALEKHPRLLVGETVPAIGKEGNEVLKDEADVVSWQNAVKALLVEEVQGRATQALDDNKDFLTTIHSSIELFQNNPDLIPMTKGFDLELANRFATLATPYELRVDGKLQGFSIPVQPLIDNLRKQIVAERAAKPAAPAAPAAAAAPAGGAPAGAPASPTGAPAAEPQGGIASKAGNSSQVEDFSTLFGTLGLPDLRI